MKRRYYRAASCWLTLFWWVCSCAAAVPDLERSFRKPPPEARPWVYWFWLNGNLTEEGMTADLEAMARAGVGGVLIMEVDQGAPVGPVAFMSDRWRELFRHMVSEAARLGIEVNMNNDAGWNGSGGPWVTPDKAMQTVVSTETSVPGGRRFDAVLAQPPANKGFYRDIATLAFATPKDQSRVGNMGSKAVAWKYMSAGSAFAPSSGCRSAWKNSCRDTTNP